LYFECIAIGDERGSGSFLDLDVDGVDGVAFFAGGGRFAKMSGKDSSESDSSSSELLTTLPQGPLLGGAGNTAFSSGISAWSLLGGGDRLDVYPSCSELLDAFEIV